MLRQTEIELTARRCAKERENVCASSERVRGSNRFRNHNVSYGCNLRVFWRSFVVPSFFDFEEMVL